MSESSSSGYGLSQVGASVRLPAPELPYGPPRPRAYAPKIGLIGCGGITEYHLRAYQALGLDVVAFCNPHIAKAEARRDEFYPEANVYADAAELLARPDIEVVDIATHPAVRVELIEAALNAGKHVLSQKPFVLDLATGHRLADLADARGLRLAVNQNGRWAPHFSYLRHAVAAGLVGDVASVDCALQWDHTWTAGTPFEEIDHLVLADFAIHWFDITTVFLGGRRALSVSATVARSPFQTFRPPSLAQVIADYGDAQVRIAFNAHVTHGQADTTTICGSLGTLRSTGPGLTAQGVSLYREEGESKPELVGNWFEQGFQGTMAELLCAIEDDREPSHSARNNLASLEFCFAAIASANAGGQPFTPGSVTALP